jgi:hypothetical protein
MTIQEFSTEFDVLYNNVTSNQAPGLNEYEKSVFLTKAQSQLVNEYFNSRTDGFGGGFDGSQKRQYDFSGLVRVEKLFDINTFKERIDDTEKLDRRSKVFLFPQDYFLAVNEILSDEKGQYSVIPLSYVEYQRLMLKPYNFPVKRAAWRILTDKRNCNYAHEDANGNNVGDLPTAGDYKIFSTWADQKRSLKVRIKVETTIFEGPIPPPTVADKFIRYNSTLMGIPIQINASCEWDNSKMNYEVWVAVTFSASDVDNVSDVDDETAIEILKEGFAFAKTTLGDNWDVYDYEVIKVANLTDGFLNCSAPSKLTTFQDDINGRTFECSVIQVPMAEIIGKFKGDIQYQLRYIRNLNPIILDDLSNYGTDLTIGGVTSETPCTLPEETHQEILERAVTLAKIAWQGGTATQAAQQRNDN